MQCLGKFLVVTLGVGVEVEGRVLLASGVWRPRMLVNILRCTAWPHHKQ